MRQALLSFLTIGCLVATGCARNHYQVRMAPTDSGFERTLTCWTVVSGDPPRSQALDAEELTRIEKCYGSAPAPGEDGRFTFRGGFALKAPQDIGGAGRLERIETSLGTLRIYAERFRESDDLEGALTKRREAVDTLVDLTLGWLRKEFGEEAAYERLERFVDKDFRRDLKNLSMHIWMTDTEFWTLGYGGVLERLWLFAHERDYLTLHDVAMIMRGPPDDPSPGLEILARLVARELEIGPKSERLAIFRDPAGLSASWNKHVCGSEYYAQYLEAHRDELEESDADEPGLTDQAIRELMLDSFTCFDLSLDDSLEVTLDVECGLISTNGTWNEAEEAVTWSALLSEHAALPTVCCATWAVPNQGEQEKRFGEVVLTEQKLASYAMWYESLSEREAEQWDKVLASCSQGRPWQEIVKAFQFEEKTLAKKLLAEQVKSLFIEEAEEE